VKLAVDVQHLPLRWYGGVRSPIPSPPYQPHNSTFGKPDCKGLDTLPAVRPQQNEVRMVRMLIRLVTTAAEGCSAITVVMGAVSITNGTPS
jgi:hypothetical protein